MFAAFGIDATQWQEASEAWPQRMTEDADFVIAGLYGQYFSETHPVIATFLKQAVHRNGARLIVVDPRQTEMTRHADLWLRQRPGTDTALFNAMAQVVVSEGQLLPVDLPALVEQHNRLARELVRRRT